MTDHRAEALDHVTATLAILRNIDQDFAGVALPDRMIATQTAATTAVLANTHALLFAAEKIAAQNRPLSADQLLAIYRDGVCAGAAAAFAVYAPCESEQDREHAAEAMVADRMDDHTFLTRAWEQINARLDGVA